MNVVLTILLITILPGLEVLPKTAPGMELKDEENAITSCAEPVTWRIGTIDSRFNIDEETLKQIMEDINRLWADAAGVNVMTYNDSGNVTLNLIYSEDQQYTDNEKQMSERINKMRKEYFSMRMNYQQKSREFQDKLNLYNSLFSEYADHVEKYNQILTRMSGSGTLSRNEDEQIKDLKKHMKFLKRDLDPLEAEVTNEDAELNQLSEKLNTYADEVNEVIYQYKNRFDLYKTFHQAIYINVAGQKKINVYQFENLDKLRLVLAHEVGHAIGLRHVDNPEAIMHSRMLKQDERELKLTDDDIREIQALCATAINQIN